MVIAATVEGRPPSAECPASRQNVVEEVGSVGAASRR